MSNWLPRDVISSMGLDPAKWSLSIRGFTMKQWMTLSSQEGSKGGMFELVPITNMKIKKDWVLVWCFRRYMFD